MLNISSCASWPSVCLLRRNAYVGLLLIVDWVVCFDAVKCYELIINFED